MTRNPRRRALADGAGSALAWLAHPATLTALVLLAVNDHILKAAYPGLLTGKLSDVAGLVLAPPLVASLVLLMVPRLPAGVVAAASTGVVGVGFALTKATATGAAVGFPPDTSPLDPAIVSVGLFHLDSAIAGGVAALLALMLGLAAVRPNNGFSVGTYVLGAFSICGLLPLAARFLPGLWGLGGLVIVAGEVLAQPPFIIAFLASIRGPQPRLHRGVVGIAIVTGLATGLLPYLAFQGILPTYGWIWPVAGALAVTGIAGAIAVARRRPAGEPAHESQRAGVAPT